MGQMGIVRSGQGRPGQYSSESGRPTFSRSLRWSESKKLRDAIWLRTEEADGKIKSFRCCRPPRQPVTVVYGRAPVNHAVWGSFFNCWSRWCDPDGVKGGSRGLSFGPRSFQPGRTSDSKLPSSPGCVALELVEAGLSLGGLETTAAFFSVPTRRG